MHILRKTMESLSGRKIYVDLGTENTLIHVKGAGLTLNEPSFISFREAGNIRQPIAMGLESKRMLGRTPEHI
ncbi:MAG: rod shape-determining protein, partial [Bdellovibrionales bacterium]